MSIKPLGATSSPAVSSAKAAIDFGEIVHLAMDSFRARKVRFTLTTLGIVIGTASLVLVVTIGLSGKQYVLSSIENIGANIIWVEYEGVGATNSSTAARDFLTLDDMRAIQGQVPGIRASSPVLNLFENIEFVQGKKKSSLVRMLCVDPEYAVVRRFFVPSGRFFDAEDFQSHNKTAAITQELAMRQFGSADLAVGQELKISGLPFTIIGTFRESVETFGQSEITEDTILIPYSLTPYFTTSNAVNQLYFSMADASTVPAATQRMLEIVKSRHQPGSVYHAGNLTQLLVLARQIANAFTVILLLLADVTIVIGGVGIMNIMLATVGDRIREIGIRKAVGATRRDIRFQFLAEAVLISMTGGILGIVVGVALPILVGLFSSYRVPISALSIVVALVLSWTQGIVFGTVPASRAAQMDPVEALRHE
jgi:putative ABC transport system permease protein